MKFKDFKQIILETITNITLKAIEIKKWLEARNLSALVTEADGRKKDFWRQAYLAICNPA